MEETVFKDVWAPFRRHHGVEEELAGIAAALDIPVELLKEDLASVNYNSAVEQEKQKI